MNTSRPWPPSWSKLNVKVIGGMSCTGSQGSRGCPRGDRAPFRPLPQGSLGSLSSLTPCLPRGDPKLGHSTISVFHPHNSNPGKEILSLPPFYREENRPEAQRG